MSYKNPIYYICLSFLTYTSVINASNISSKYSLAHNASLTSTNVLLADTAWFKPHEGLLDFIYQPAAKKLSSAQTQAISYLAAQDFLEHEFWVQPFVLNGAQQERVSKNILSHDEHITGISWGYDVFNLKRTQVSGISLTLSLAQESNFAEQASNNQSHNHNLLAYGRYVYDNNWFKEWVAVIGINKVNQQRGVNLGPINEVANAKYNWYTGAFEVLTGYQFKAQGILLSPALGLSYNYMQNEAYQESGGPSINLNVASHNTNNINLIADCSLARRFSFGSSYFMPKVYAKFMYALTSNDLETHASFVGVKNYSFITTYNPGRAHYKTGAFLKIDNFFKLDSTLGIDLDFTSGYLSYSFYTKIGFNF